MEACMEADRATRERRESERLNARTSRSTYKTYRSTTTLVLPSDHYWPLGWNVSYVWPIGDRCHDRYTSVTCTGILQTFYWNKRRCRVITDRFRRRDTNIQLPSPTTMVMWLESQKSLYPLGVLPFMIYWYRFNWPYLSTSIHQTNFQRSDPLTPI